MRYLLSIAKGIGIWGIVVTSVLTTASQAQAAEEIVFRYGILRQRLSVVELAKFAETGEQSPVLARYLRRTNSEPEEVRRILTQSVDVSSGTLDKGLNNVLGNVLLDELGQIIQTPNDEGNREAIREALIASASADNKLTILEVLQNYPAEEIHLDVKRAIRTYNRIAQFQKPARNAIERIGPLREMLKERGINLPDFLR